ncbi:hypothetical protein [Ferrovibrio xuzhouensis]|uniref:Uncharacterized protein n=1 Tax=Ferrovibrio xuzhouensis TaxID=1576914 RepID=A0ABV7VJX5_9PROT
MRIDWSDLQHGEMTGRLHGRQVEIEGWFAALSPEAPSVLKHWDLATAMTSFS